MNIFKLPDLGEGLPEAEIQTWHVSAGDMVQIDQPIVAMETAKAVVDIPSPITGKLLKLYGQVGDIIKTDEPLFAFEETNASAAESHADSKTVVGTVAEDPAVLTEPQTELAPSKMQHQSVRSTPAARKLARSLAVDLAKIAGTGPDGIITKADVAHADTLSQTDAASSLPQRNLKPLQGTRRAMAHTMTRAHTQVVPVTVTEAADLSLWTERGGITLRLIRAIIAACRAEPILNAHLFSDSLTLDVRSEINLGIAVDTHHGLYVPVIHNASERSSDQLREKIESFKKSAKENAFKPEDMEDPTITLSNFGTITGHYATPIVIPPTVAILGVGKLRSAVVVEHGRPAVHPILPLSLTVDHRAVTGGEALRFLAAFMACLEQNSYD